MSLQVCGICLDKKLFMEPVIYLLTLLSTHNSPPRLNYNMIWFTITFIWIRTTNLGLECKQKTHDLNLLCICQSILQIKIDWNQSRNNTNISAWSYTVLLDILAHWNVKFYYLEMTQHRLGMWGGGDHFSVLVIMLFLFSNE